MTNPELEAVMTAVMDFHWSPPICKSCAEDLVARYAARWESNRLSPTPAKSWA